MVGPERRVRAAAPVSTRCGWASSASRRWPGSAATARLRRPFEGLSALDIGCGGGLLCEPMARLGFAVTGVDASERRIGAASAHAAQLGLEIDYRCFHRRGAAGRGRAIRPGAEHGGDRARGRSRRVPARHRRPARAWRPDDRRHPQPHPEVAGAGQDRRRVRAALGSGRHPRLAPLPAARRSCAASWPASPSMSRVHSASPYDPIAGRWSLSSDTAVNYMMTVSARA